MFGHRLSEFKADFDIVGEIQLQQNDFHIYSAGTKINIPALRNLQENVSRKSLNCISLNTLYKFEYTSDCLKMIKTGSE